MKRGWVAILLAMTLAAMGAAAPEPSGNDRLRVTQDEASMERVIESYLTSVYKVDVQEKTAQAGDLVLLVKMEGKGGPDFAVVVDTQCTNRDGDGQVVERTVSVQIYTGVKVPGGKRAAVLEAVNKFQAGSWYASIYLDEDDEISCQWCVNVMKEGLPTDYVADAIVRVAESWRKFRPLAEQALSGE